MPHILADVNIAHIEDACKGLGTIELFETRNPPRESLLRADVLLCRSTLRVDETLLRGSNIRFVATATSGSEHVDKEYLRNVGIRFANAAGSNALSVAEYLFTALFSLASNARVSLLEKSIGIIGVGHVGTWVEHLARNLGLRRILNDPPRKERSGDPALLSLEEALEADIVSLHVTLTAEGPHATARMADLGFFERTRRGVLFVNTSRGGVIDEESLMESCEREQFLGVALDVFDSEPFVNTDLFQYADLVTPHIAGYSYDGKLLGTQMVYEALCEYLSAPAVWSYLQMLPDVHPLRLVVPPRATLLEDIVTGLLKQVYDIRRDDRALRRTVLYPASERGRYFDTLRSTYGLRREFPAITIESTGLPDDILFVLTALGFTLA